MLKPRIQTLLAAAGCEVDEASGALTPPIHLATTYERDADLAYSRGYVYSRLANPTRDALERVLAELEEGEAAAAFSSGMAAANAILSVLRPGDHVLIPDDVYYGVRKLLATVFEDWGLEWSAVDERDANAVRAALRPNTRLVWIETPSNPLVKIVDLAATIGIAREAGALSLVDCTWTPFLQEPLALGADFVLHSSTKYLGGHSDALGGVLVARAAGGLFERVRHVQREAGAVLDPFTSWLTLRGLRSLAPRLRVHCENAQAIAAWAATRAEIASVHYPGLASHEGHALAARQMDGFGGMLSLRIAGGREAAIEAAARLRVFRRATSLGGTESLVEHRASIEGPGTATPDDLLRLSIGLECAGDLIADLEQALAAH